MEHMIEEIKWKHLHRKAQLLFFSEWKTLLISMAAIVIYAVGVVGFTIPYKFADQGVMGIAVLLKYTLGLNPAYVLLVLNIILLAWGARTLPYLDGHKRLCALRGTRHTPDHQLPDNG